jgi:hypothetical protein
MHYLPPPESGRQSIPFRWIFPLGQLFLCLFLLSIVRVIPFFSWRINTTVTTGIMMLNAPGLLVHLPEILLRPDHGFWKPLGIDFRTWQALTTSAFGTLFWWMAGRAVEALLALKNRQSRPQITWLETIVCGLIMSGGAFFLSAGVVYGVFIDHEVQSFHFGATGGLWALLGSLSVIARFRQWRLRKKMLAQAA